MRVRAPRRLKPDEPKQLPLADFTKREPFRRRTFMPVRRDSFPLGECEADWYRPTNWKQKRDLIQAASEYDDAGKQPGIRWGPLGPNGLRLLRTLLKRIDHETGQLDPSIETLMEWTRLTRKAVLDARARLQGNGFLKWIRRFVRTGEKGVRGPQVAQTSNAYRLEMPEKAKALLKHLFAPSKPQCDAADRAERSRQRTIWERDYPGDPPASPPPTPSRSDLSPAMRALRAAAEGRRNASPHQGAGIPEQKL